VKHDQVTVVLGADMHLGTVATEEASVVVDPDLDRGIIRGRPGRLARPTRDEEWKEQTEIHGALPELLLPYWKLRRGTALGQLFVLREPRASVDPVIP
jgi:hypothetical protein